MAKLFAVIRLCDTYIHIININRISIWIYDFGSSVKVTIDSAFKKLAENKTKDLQVHFVFAGYFYMFIRKKLHQLMIEGMKKYNLKNVMMTIISMKRVRLITKEKRDEYCLGNVHSREKKSFNCDLESLLEQIRLGQTPEYNIQTYFMPRLTEEEIELVERKDDEYMKTFSNSQPDVTEAEMKISQSDSKFCLTACSRTTITVENIDKRGDEDDPNEEDPKSRVSIFYESPHSKKSKLN